MQEIIIIKSKKQKILVLSIIMYLIGIICGGIYIKENFFEWTVFHETWFFWVGLLIAAPFILIGFFFALKQKKGEMTVTNLRVYGKSAFGKRVDLPMDSITSVGTCAFNGIAVATSSGYIRFRKIANRDEIHHELSKLLMNRQEKGKVELDSMNSLNEHNAIHHALMEYKELLDNGVITQEEFEAKKRQILGL